MMLDDKQGFSCGLRVQARLSMFRMSAGEALLP